MPERSRREPVHRQLERLLRAEIASGRLACGALIPPEVELARRFGISRSTVRQATGALVAAGLVRRDVGRGTLVIRREPLADPSARGTVGLVVTQLGGMFLAHILGGVSRALAAAGHALTVETSGFRPGGEEDALDRLRQRGAVGALVELAVACGTPERAYADLAAGGFPCVFFDRHPPETELPWVASDNLRGGRQLAGHLLRLGRRRLAYLVSRDYPSTSVDDRIRGVRWAMAEAGGGPDGLRLVHVPGGFDEPQGAAVRRALGPVFAAEASDIPDALVCANDDLAMEAMGTLREMGLAVPDDVAVTGFDDLPFAAHLDPPLTTARQDAAGIGQAAVGLLLERLSSPGRPVRTVRLPVELCVRGSTIGRGAGEPAAAQATTAARAALGGDR